MNLLTRHIERPGIRAVILIAMLAAELVAIAPGTAAQSKSKPSAEPSPAATEYKTVLKEYEAEQQEFYKAYEAAKTDEARQKVSAKYPKPDKYSTRFLELARKYPIDPAAVDALVWVVKNDRNGDGGDEALNILFADHLENKKLSEVAQTLVYSQSKNAEKFLRDLREKSPHREVKAQATLNLGQVVNRQAELARALKEAKDQGRAASWEKFYGKESVAKLKAADPDQITKEAEQLFEEVTTKYSDVGKSGRGKLADAAKGELFEMRNLAIGKVAPDIEGQDMDGKTFKLSEYRDKVVVIDFFGDW